MPLSLPGNALGLGKVVQVVGASTSTTVSSSTSAWSDTGLTATITPLSTTSKILVLLSQNGLYKNNNGNSQGSIQLLRDSSVIGLLTSNFGFNGSNIADMDAGSVSITFVDSPATIAAVTYKTQFRSNNNNAAVHVQQASTLSTITLMEIAA